MKIVYILLLSTPCVNHNVRLIGGLVPTEGTAQMCVGALDQGENCAMTTGATSFYN